MKTLAEFAAYKILKFPENGIKFDKEDNYSKTLSIELIIKQIKNSESKWIHSFTIGCDKDNGNNVWAFGNGGALTSHEQKQKIVYGAEIGDIIKIENQQFQIENDFNKNIKFAKV